MRFANALPIVGGIFAAVLTGSIIGTGSALLIGAMSALVIGSFAVAASSFRITLALFFLTFVVQGSVKFFVGSSALGWAATGLSVILLVRVAIEKTSIAYRSTASGGRHAPVLTMVLLSFYLLCFILSLLINWPPLFQVISSVKNAIPMLSILLAVYWLPWGTKQLSQLWGFIVTIAFLQLPLVVYQHFFVAASRITQGWDSVVGSMGGSLDGGGLNAMLVVFCLAALAYVLARVKRRLSSNLVGWTTAFIVVAIIVLGEVKAAFVWMPLVFVYFYGREILRKPAKAIAYASIGLLAMVAMFLAYEQLYWQGNKLERSTATEKIEKMSSYFFDDKNINYITGEVSRGASLALWWRDSKSNILNRTIGYGPGASKSKSALGPGEVAIRYSPLSIDATSSAVYLWDTGIVGLLTYMGFLLTPLLIGWRLVNSKSLVPEEAAVLDASVITLGLLSTFLIYNRTLTDEPTVQLLLFFVIGSILRAKKVSGRPAESALRTTPTLAKNNLSNPMQLGPQTA